MLRHEKRRRNEQAMRLPSASHAFRATEIRQALVSKLQTGQTLALHLRSGILSRVHVDTVLRITQIVLAAAIPRKAVPREGIAHNLSALGSTLETRVVDKANHRLTQLHGNGLVASSRSGNIMNHSPYDSFIITLICILTPLFPRSLGHPILHVNSGIHRERTLLLVHANHDPLPYE